MKRKHELNIEVLSSIKDEIIDKQSKKRFDLMNRKRTPKWIIPSSVAAVFLVAIMIPLFIVLFPKQVPVYEGMTVSTTYQPSKNTVSSGSVTMLSASGSSGSQISFLKDDNGNHNGHNKKPVEDIVDDEASSSLTVPDQHMYYAQPSQDIYITVHISNPDSYEILSFTLNGKKYSSYMFEDGSDMENLILKVTVPAGTEGITEYTIDAIKYVDGTAIKDVRMEGNRTVKVGVYSAGKQPTAQVADELIGINDISFTVSINDQLDLIRMSEGNAYAVICDDDSVIYKQELDLDNVNNIKFDGLDMDTTYRYAIVANYDSLDGTSFSTHILYEKEFTTKNNVAFKPTGITQNSISFTLEWEESFENKVLDSLALYKGEEKIRELDVNTTSIDGLLSNNEYRLVATYTNKGETEISDLIFTTVAKATPEITISETDKTQTSLGFDISVTDIDNVGAITKLELICGDDVQNITDLSTREFTNLLSNNTYTVKVTYTYDLNDGVGKQTIEKTADITTEEKAEPIFTFNNMASATFYISGEYDIANVDNTLISYKVELYRGDELVKENTDKDIAFDSLEYYTDYTVKITYMFDVNDGKSVQTKTAEYAIKTLPYIDVTECKIANTSAVSEGETIFMQVKLDNPLNMTIESVVVNGETYNVTGASTEDRIFVEIVYDGQFAGGDTYLKVDKVNTKIDETALTIEPKTELSDSVFINGKLEVLKIEYINESFEPIDWAFPSETVYMLITLDNPTGYTVDNIYHNETNPISDIIKVDNNHLYYAIPDFGYGWNAHTLSSITYHNEYVEKTLTYSNISALCYKVASDDTVYVSTPDDLKNMNDGYYYELSGDIDLSDLEWLGNEFNGVFDGKGYSIKNMSFVGTKKNADAYIGLFSRGCGVIKNLNIKETTVIADLRSDDGNKYELHCGGIVAYVNNPISILNCTVDEDSVFGVTNTTGGSAHVGGLLGRGWYVKAWISNCTNASSITALGLNVYATGGFVGSISQDSTITVVECENTGAINGGHSGGLLGFGGDGTYTGDNWVHIENSVNSGAIKGQYSAGGLIGSLSINSVEYKSDFIVSNCFNVGSVGSDGPCGGLIGHFGDVNTIIINCADGGIVNMEKLRELIGDHYSDISVLTVENCYSLTSSNGLCYGESCTVDQLNSKEFYTETLGWSEDIWDFSELDYENGKYPKLK